MQYFYWSKNLNVHFGHYRLGEPLGLESMLKGMNVLVGKLLNLSSTQPAKLLDLGCGFGATTQHLSGLFPMVSFTGVNISEVQVAVANARLADPQIRKRAQFVESDFQSTPFDEASFDGAFALESVCFAEGENKEKLLKEVARLLRPGSRFVVIDGFRKHDRPLPRLVGWIYQKCITAWEIPSLAPIGGFELSLKAHGFSNIIIRDISWNIAPTLAHIPFIAVKLCVAYAVHRDEKLLRYLKALLLTLSMSPFKRHFGYYTVTCQKSALEMEK